MLNIKKYQGEPSLEFIDVMKLLGFQTKMGLIKEFEKGLNETYLNDSWLDKQTFKEGNINVSSFFKEIVVGKEIPDNLGEQMEKDLDVYLNHYNTKVKELEAHFRELRPAWDIINKAHGGESELKLAQDVIDRAKRREPNYNDFSEIKTSVGNKKFIVLDNKLSVEVKKEFQELEILEAPALTREQIKTLAKSCSILVKERERFEFGVVDFIKDIDNMIIDDIKNTAQLEKSEIPGKWKKIINSNFYTARDLNNLFQNKIGDKIMAAQIQQMIHGAASYIKASMK